MDITGSILRNNKVKNILTGSTHERQNSNMALTGHNFWAFKFNEHFKTWDNRYNPMPTNWIEFLHTDIPIWLDFDLILSQHKFGQYQVFAPAAKQWKLPLISLEHTAYTWQDPSMKPKMNSMRGDVNVFITEWSLESWGWEDRNDTVVIGHGIDTSVFNPGNKERKNHILNVVNDYIGRGDILGFDVYQHATQGLPTRRIGDSPGFSEPAKSIPDLVNEYQTSKVFINTSILSPMPMSLLESLACFPEGEFLFHGFVTSKVEDIYNIHSPKQTILDKSILHKHKNRYVGDIFKIKPRFLPPIRVTAEHPVKVVNIVSQRRKKSEKYLGEYKHIISEPIFKFAKNLNKNDYVIFPKYKKEIPLNMSKEWLTFYGLYLAEGCTYNGYIDFCLHEKETELIENIKYIGNLLNKNVAVRKPDPNSKAIKVILHDTYLSNYLARNFHGYSHEKIIPEEFINASKQEIKWFLDAYIQGDGSTQKYTTGNNLDREYIQIITTSKHISYQVLLMLSKLDILATWTSSGPRIGIIKGREFNCRERYSISVMWQPKLYKKYKEDNNNFYIPICDITRIGYDGFVYNFTVAEPHEFQTPFFITHNCGTVPVALNNCAIPTYIQDGYNGFLVNNAEDMRDRLQLLLTDDELWEQMSKNAVKSIEENCSISKFVDRWNKVFERVS